MGRVAKATSVLAFFFYLELWIYLSESNVSPKYSVLFAQTRQGLQRQFISSLRSSFNFVFLYVYEKKGNQIIRAGVESVETDVPPVDTRKEMSWV